MTDDSGLHCLKCAIKSCGRSRQDGVKLFRFPVGDSDMNRAWRERCNIPPNVTKTLRICNRHFVKDFVGKARLKPNAIPSLNLDNPIYEDNKANISEAILSAYMKNYARSEPEPQPELVPLPDTTMKNMVNFNDKTVKQGKPRITRRTLTFDERIGVIHDYEKCKSSRILSEKYRCGKKQILSIVRNKHIYLKEWLTSPDASQKFRRQSGLFLSLGIILNEWVERAKAYPEVLISNEQIRKIACEIAQFINFRFFHPNYKWLERFKNKYNITEDSLLKRDRSNGFYHNMVQKSLNIEDIVNDVRGQLSSRVILNDTELNSDSYSNHSSLQTFDPTIPAVVYGDDYENENSSFAPEKEDNDENEMVELVDIMSDSYHSENSASYDDNTQEVGENCNDEEQEQKDNENGEEEELSNYNEALQQLQKIEQFVLLREDLRAVGLVNQLENHFKECVNQGK